MLLVASRAAFAATTQPTYADEMKTLTFAPSRVNGGEAATTTDTKLLSRLNSAAGFSDLTGLGYFLPAVSGATAVENALKVALVAQVSKTAHPGPQGGLRGQDSARADWHGQSFLQGTHRSALRRCSLRRSVCLGRPAQIDALMERHEFAVVQLELIQSVGGVRRIPERVIRHLDDGRKRWGYLLLVDEVQTGMYRTGPFSQSRTVRHSRPTCCFSARVRRT